MFQTYARQLSGDSRDHEVTAVDTRRPELTSNNLKNSKHTSADTTKTPSHRNNSINSPETEKITDLRMGKNNKVPGHFGDDNDDDGGILILGGRDKRDSEPLLTAPTRYVHKSRCDIKIMGPSQMTKKDTFS